jgi:hypothetical protein
MTATTATAVTTSRDAWMLAFPTQEAHRAVEYLCEMWNEFAATRPKAFNNRENKITEALGNLVDRSSQGRGRLLGFWNYEVPKADLHADTDDDLKAVRRIRKDIVYQSNRTERIVLIFEFKKLQATKSSAKNYRGVDGMRRFIDGNYAKGLPLAIMVGMLIGDKENCIDTLRRSILSVAGKTDLRMVADPGGNLIQEPSLLFPALADFDTEHNRPTDRAPSHGTMRLSHVFVQMPEVDS